MPFTLDQSDAYPTGTAIINQELTVQDVHLLNQMQIMSIALNGSYGWTGVGFELLSEMPSLQRVSLLSGSSLSFKTELSLPNLKWLYVGGNIRSALNFTKIPSLEVLRIGGSRLNLIHLDAAQKLQEIHGNFAEDQVFEFAKVPTLKTLKLSNGKFSNLNWLRGFSLRALDMKRSVNLDDLGAISSQQGLEYLQFDNCKKIKQIKSLAEIPTLQCLQINGCGDIESLLPIGKLNSLKIVSFLDTNILDGNIAVLENNNAALHVRFTDKKHYDRKSSQFCFDQGYFTKLYREYESE